MRTIGKIFSMVGLLILALSTVGSIGYGLWLWGGLGGVLSTSAWAGFVLWMKMIIGGLLMLFIGIGMSEI